jgi:hypothetical protein
VAPTKTSDLGPQTSDRRPLRARAFERLEDGHVAIRVPKFDGRILGKYLMPRLKRPDFLVHLDEVGSFVWDLCDGSLTPAEIAARMAERFPELKNPAGRLDLFLRQLAGQGHVRDAGSAPRSRG